MSSARSRTSVRARQRCCPRLRMPRQSRRPQSRRRRPLAFLLHTPSLACRSPPPLPGVCTIAGPGRADNERWPIVLLPRPRTSAGSAGATTHRGLGALAGRMAPPPWHRCGDLPPRHPRHGWLPHQSAAQPSLPPGAVRATEAPWQHNASRPQDTTDTSSCLQSAEQPEERSDEAAIAATSKREARGPEWAAGPGPELTPAGAPCRWWLVLRGGGGPRQRRRADGSRRSGRRAGRWRSRRTGRRLGAGTRRAP